MLIQGCNTRRFFRTAAVGLLASCAWLSTTTTALAQDQPAPQGQRTDSAIQSDIAAAIAQDSTLKGQHVSATCAQGIVTLTGTVQTGAQRGQAETDAANVSGVIGILNKIEAANPNSGAPAAGITDQDSANQLNPQAQSQAQSQPQDQPQAQPQAQDQSQQSVPPPPPDEQSPQPPPPPVYRSPQPYPQGGYAPPPQQYPQGRQYPQGGYAPPPQQYPQQGYTPAPQPYYATPGPVTVPAGILLRVRLSQPLDTKTLKTGTIFQATTAVDVYVGGVLSIPRGATLTGEVVESKNAGDLGGSAILRLQLTDINLEGKNYQLASDIWSSKGPNKAGYTAGNTAGGAVLGAIIGGIIGRGAGAAVGAGIGATGGLAASAATGGPRIYLPAESTVDFHLTEPATVQPVSWQEAQRLASTAPSQPVLVQRPQRPVYVAPAPYPYYGPYPYAYPYPY